MKPSKYLITVLMLLLLSSGAQAYTLSEIDLEGTYGSGDNSALLVVDFTAAEYDSFAWEINFSDSTVTVEDLLTIVDNYDDDFSFTIQSETLGTIGTITYGSYSKTPPPMWLGYSSSDLGETWTSEGIRVASLTVGGEGGAFGLTPNLGQGDPVTPTVPVPGAVWLLGSGLIGLIGIRRKPN